MHNGDDYGGSFPVLVAADGVVVRVGASLSKRSGFGYFVIIEHRALGLRTLYAHGAHRSKLIRGRAVKRGATVFQSGTTGASTGNHLHFEVHERDQFGRWRPVNPAPILLAFTGDETPLIPVRLKKLIAKVGPNMKCMILGNLDTGSVAFLVLGGEGYIFQSAAEYNDFRTVINTHNSLPFTPDEWKWPTIPELNKESILFVNNAQWTVTVKAVSLG